MMKRLLLILAFLPIIGFGQLRDTKLINTMSNAVDYKTRFIPDGGVMNSDNLLKATYFMLEENGLYAGTKLLFMPELGIKTRADEFLTKGYDLSSAENDVSQVTAINQPFLIKPTEGSVAIYGYSDTYVTHSDIVVPENGTYTVIRGSCNYGDYFVDVIVNEVSDTTLNGIHLNDEYLYFYMIYESTISPEVHEKLANWLRSWVVHESVALIYGIEYGYDQTSPTVTRIGSTQLHQQLPIQSNMRGCLMLDNGTINYYLKADDWSKKADGTASDLSGADGMVMVHIPNFYIRFEEEGLIQRVLISLTPLEGFTAIPDLYISAFEAALDRTALKLASVINTTTQYRGGNNTASWDSEDRTLLGMPATSISRTNFRTYARNRGAGWEMYTYLHHKILTWLFVIEYATRNSQLAVNNSLTAQGFRQGGLGVGVTNIAGANWNTWKAFNPFIACGYSNSLGNASGEVAFQMPAGYGATLTTNVNRYRGIELPFGHIWKNTDGVLVNIQADGAGGESQFFATDNPANFSDVSTANMELRGLLPRTQNVIEKVTFGSKGDIMPATLQSNVTQFWCDYFFISVLPTSGSSLRTLLWGGSAGTGSLAGLVTSYSDFSPASAAANFGSRLCFIP